MIHLATPRIRFVAVAALAVTCGASALVFAADPANPTAAKRRSAKNRVSKDAGAVSRVLEDYARAVGGTAAWRKLKSIQISMSISIQAMNIKGSGERISTSDGRFYDAQTFPSLGLLAIGSDGKEIWSKDPINGLRVLSGA